MDSSKLSGLASSATSMVRAPECLTELEIASAAIRSRLYSASGDKPEGFLSNLSFKRTSLVSVIWRAAWANDWANDPLRLELDWEDSLSPATLRRVSRSEV